MDEEDIKKMKQKRLVKAIVDEDKGLNNFGIAKRVQKIMSEQQKRKKRRKGMKKEGPRRLTLHGMTMTHPMVQRRRSTF